LSVSGNIKLSMQKTQSFLKRITPISAVVVLIFSCYRLEKTAGIAYWSPYKSDSMEIKIPYRVKGKGNVHQLNLKDYEFNDADWIYLSKVPQSTNADKLLLTHERGKIIYPWIQSNLRGKINILDSTLTINLQLPIYNDSGKIERWEEYKFNGIYNLRAAD
jgi:hypothetical protein